MLKRILPIILSFNITWLLWSGDLSEIQSKGFITAGIRKISTALSVKEDLPYKTNIFRKRLRKVIDDLIRVGCKLVHHARKWLLKLWNHDPWVPVFKK